MTGTYHVITDPDAFYERRSSIQPQASVNALPYPFFLQMLKKFERLWDKGRNYTFS
jgi:hypothetical protein